MAKHKRELKNMVINRPFQLRMSYYFVAISIGLMGLLVAYMNSRIGIVRIELANAPGLPFSIQTNIDEQLNGLVSTAVGFLLISTVGTLIYGLVISHRIAGPMYAILKYIEVLKTGDYENRRALRPYDELAPIMSSLHELADRLKTKN